jgi:hypothetical protein
MVAAWVAAALAKEAAPGQGAAQREPPLRPPPPLTPPPARPPARPLVPGPRNLQSLAQGAATQTFLATSEAVPALSGEYFADCNLSPSSPAAHDAALSERLWAMSERMCGFA